MAPGQRGPGRRHGVSAGRLELCRGGPWEQRGIVGYALAAGFYLPAHPQLPDELVASAVVRAPEGHPLLTLAPSVNAGKRIGTAVSAVPVVGATLYVPLVSNQAEGWRSGIQLQNGAPQPAPVTLRFLDPLGNTVIEVDDVVPPSGAKTYYLPSMLGLPVGFVGALVIQGRLDATLSAVVNDVR